MLMGASAEAGTTIASLDAALTPVASNEVLHAASVLAAAIKGMFALGAAITLTGRTNDTTRQMTLKR
jgi:hypothetical protein